MIDLLKKTYSGKKIFLTGHTGFKGSWLLMIFEYLGAEVCAYALPAADQPSFFDMIQGANRCQHIIGDIRDKVKLSKAILNFQPDFVFHLAAQALVRTSYINPIETYETNVLGTAHVLDALRNLEKLCNTIIVTTDKVYENNELGFPYKETDALGGYDPYSSSKACAEIVCSSYRRSFFHPEKYKLHQKGIASARAGNVIGGGDWNKDRIIPDFIRALTNQVPLEIRSPESVRPWQHVLEPLAGYLCLGARLAEDPQKYSKAYNFGPYPEDDLKVIDLVKLAIGHWGSGSFIDASNPNAPHEAKLLTLDIQLAVKELGWKPQLNAEQSIALTLNWYKNYLDDPAGLTLAQIKSYFQ
jgi:CDP-glucose 4,6-dehydratase